MGTFRLWEHLIHVTLLCLGTFCPGNMLSICVNNLSWKHFVHGNMRSCKGKFCPGEHLFLGTFILTKTFCRNEFFVSRNFLSEEHVVPRNIVS